ncbi:MAG: hypothetical protein QOH31_2860 [Verrucomicrobiota bacterium]|jgi:hypothetical protein
MEEETKQSIEGTSLLVLLTTDHRLLITQRCPPASVLLDLEVLEPLEGLFHFVIINVLLAFRTEFRSD